MLRVFVKAKWSTALNNKTAHDCPVPLANKGHFVSELMASTPADGFHQANAFHFLLHYHDLLVHLTTNS